MLRMVRFTDCWAKTTEAGQPGVSVFHHCVNVGMVADQLARSAALTTRCGFAAEGIAVLAAIHDIGKVSPGFQQKCPAWIQLRGLIARAQDERWAVCESDHSRVSQFSIGRLLKGRGMKVESAQAWATAIGAHHGAPHGWNPGGLPPKAGMKDDEWEAQRQALAFELERVFATFAPPAFQPDDPRLWAIAGLVSVADWIGSDEARFPPERGLPIEESRTRAEDAVHALGMDARHIAAGLDFGALFGGGFRPNSLQQAALAVVRKPGVYILEAPMGMGKTEAALAAAYRLLADGSAGGLYFALPTQATSNRIHERMAPFVERISGGAHGVRLIHAMSWLKEDLHLPALRRNAPDPPRLPKEAQHEAERAREAAAWFRGAKRAILEPFGVGTVDQALLGVVAAKHFFVRLYALAGKVVVLDEIHSYDRYTGSLVDALVADLEALGSTVLILSATLTRQRVAELLKLSPEAAQALPDGFPRIVGRAYGSGEIVHALAEPPPAKQVRIRFREHEAAMDGALEAAKAGACVLWICDTVNAAQETARLLMGNRNEGDPEIGLLHSRFPFFRREELENYWLDALGPPSAGKARPHGCILVSTQIVEQSVDVDADLLITELAPTDMLLQRLGRLWRHEREGRAGQPEAWILSESATLDELRTLDAATIRAVFGAKGKVYAPYILLRTLVEWSGRDAIAIPSDIRPLIEATYAAMPDEPPAWRELREHLKKEEDEKLNLALVAQNTLNKPSLSDREGVQTRLNEQPTINVVLARHSDQPAAVVLSNSEQVDLTRRDFQIVTAKALHRNLVRLPLYWFLRDNLPKQDPRLVAHGARDAVLFTISDGAVEGARLAPGISLRYTPFLGFEARRMEPQSSRRGILPDDDEPYD